MTPVLSAALNAFLYIALIAAMMGTVCLLRAGIMVAIIVALAGVLTLVLQVKRAPSG